MGQNHQRRHVCFVQFARRQHQRQSLLSPTVSCFFKSTRQNCCHEVAIASVDYTVRLTCELEWRWVHVDQQRQQHNQHRQHFRQILLTEVVVLGWICPALSLVDSRSRDLLIIILGHAHQIANNILCILDYGSCQWLLLTHHRGWGHISWHTSPRYKSVAADSSLYRNFPQVRSAELSVEYYSSGQ